MMTYKHTTISIIIFALTLFVGVFMMIPSVAYAVENLVVVFEDEPLFSEANFLPGNAVVRTVEVTNNTAQSQDIIVEAINFLDDDGLGDVLDLVIKEGTMTHYSKTLGVFLRAGEVPLSSLGAGNSTTYTFSVTFDGSSNNDTQGMGLGFDLCVGFEGGNTHCGGTVVEDEKETDNGGSRGGGGGGGPVNITPLEVFDEEVTATNAVTTTAVIEWDSNLLSTSRVIYGREADGPYSLNLTVLPNFGYPSSTIETLNKVTHHVVTLTGLEVDTTYVYRVVSRSSPPTVGFQQTFALGEEDDSGSPSVPSAGTGGTLTSPTGGTGEGAPVGSTEVQDTEAIPTEESLLSTTSTQVAALGFLTLPDDLFGWLKCFALLLLFIILIYIAWILWRDSNKRNYTKEKLRVYRKLFFFVGLLLSIIAAYVLGWECTIIPLIVLAIIALVLYVVSLFTNKDDSDVV